MKHGIVTSVKTNNTGHIVAKVQSSRAGVIFDNCVVQQPNQGTIQHIEEGYHVGLEICDDGLKVITGVLSTDESLLSGDYSKGERTMKFDDGTEITASPDGSGGYDVDVRATGDVTIESDSHIQLTAPTIDLDTSV